MADDDTFDHYRQVELHTLGRNVVLGRVTQSNPAAAFIDSGRQPSGEDNLRLALYTEICNSWRALVDVRFKLLGLVPSVSAALLTVLLVQKPGEGPGAVGGVVIGMFGLIVVTALAIYDQRNSQLHDELISRGRRLEEELGVLIGQFRGRPSSWRFVKHDIALATIYIATAAAWVAAVIVFLART